MNKNELVSSEATQTFVNIIFSGKLARFRDCLKEHWPVEQRGHGGAGGAKVWPELVPPKRLDLLPSLAHRRWGERGPQRCIRRAKDFRLRQKNQEYPTIVFFVPLQWGGTVRRRRYQATALNAIATAATIAMTTGHVHSTDWSCPNLGQESSSKMKERGTERDNERDMTGRKRG